jgi:hypothetical protein
MWPGNSLDINAIELVWPDMKREITKKGAPTNRKQAEVIWPKIWQEIP